MSGAHRDWVWVALAIAVFCVLGFWIIMNTSSNEALEPPYSTYTYDPSGCRALFELLNRAGMPAERYGGTEYNLPDKGCIALVSDSSAEMTSFMTALLDNKAIQLWVEEGGTLVLVTDPHSLLADNLVRGLDEPGEQSESEPAASLAPPTQVISEVGNGESGSEAAFSREYKPGKRFELSQPISLIWDTVGKIEIAEPEYTIQLLKDELLVDRNTAQPVVMYEKRGQGAMYWLTTPEIVTNKWLAREDNHRLVLNLFGMAAAGRDVLFFEKIHGYTEQRQNAGTLLFKTHGGRLLLVFGLCIVLAFAPLAVRPSRTAPAPVPPRRHTAEMVYAQADLFARAGKYRLASERLIGRLAGRLAQHGVLPSGAGLDGLKALLEKSGMHGERGTEIIFKVIGGGSVANSSEFARLARECEAVYGKLVPGGGQAAPE